MEYFRITEENSDSVLELFGKATDSEGYIIEKRTGKKLTCPYTREHIKITDFSILPGSAVFVNNKSFCFSEHRAKHE